MNLAEAEGIIQSYGAILETASVLYPYGAPESLLPYPKNTIRTAITMALRAGKNNQKLKDSLGIDYVELASFIPDDESKVAHKVRLAQQNPEMYTGKSLTAVMDQALAIVKKQQAERERLLRELQSL